MFVLSKPQWILAQLVVSTCKNPRIDSGEDTFINQVAWGHRTGIKGDVVGQKLSALAEQHGISGMEEEGGQNWGLLRVRI